MIQLNLHRTKWIIFTEDDRAEPVISALARAMSLTPVLSGEFETSSTELRSLRVEISSDSTSIVLQEDQPVVCHILPPDDDHVLLHNMMAITQTIVRGENMQGNLLIHGALAQSANHPQKGILLAGPGNVGKTTASNRLPPPWRSLSDDTSLVTKDPDGRYYAHPWPTWSRFFSTDGTSLKQDNQWKVEQRIPLEAIFFLRQADEDHVTPLSETSSLAFLMETVLQVSPRRKALTMGEARLIEEKLFTAATELVRSIPSYTLACSMTGKFWEIIEKIMGSETITSTSLSDNAAGSTAFTEVQASPPQPPFPDDIILSVSYSGPSMNPVLRQPDLLEVLPYEGKRILPGDIVYFQSPEYGYKVIHRVVQVTPDGIRTQGDNNPSEDPYVLLPNDIIGKVIAAWRNGHRRKIAGGLGGKISGYCSRVRNHLNRILSRALHTIYRELSAKCFLHNLLPLSFRPKVFEFKQQHLPSILKLMVNGHVIGQYDSFKKLWMIDRPWKLVVDERMLPVVDDCTKYDTPSPMGPTAINTPP